MFKLIKCTLFEVALLLESGNKILFLIIRHQNTMEMRYMGLDYCQVYFVGENGWRKDNDFQGDEKFIR